MDKLLRGLIILLLVLSIGALVLEIIVFGQRGELKGRNLMLVGQTVELAKTIEVPPGTNVDLTTRNLQRITLSDEQFKHFYQVDAAGKPVKDATGKKMTSGPGTLDATLRDLVAKAGIQMTRLNDTRSTLEQTRTELGETKDTLKETEDNLDAAKQDIKQKADTIATQKADIEQKTESIAKLEDEKDSLETKVDKQATEITALNTKVTDREAKLQATTLYVQKLKKQLDQLLKGADSDTNAPPPGLQGQILVVNSSWNFVVIDILPGSALMPMTDLVIQRDAKLIGKVRVSEVVRDRNFAVGEVLMDWQQAPVAKGDYVFY